MPLTRRNFLKTSLAGASALGLGRLAAGSATASPTAPTVATKPKTASTAVAKVPAQPNILLLWSDQHRGDTVPWAGNRVIRAPHLAALAEQSFIFDQAYCAQPVCTPSRGSILTGLMPHNHGCIRNNLSLPAEIRTLAEYVPAEYETAYYGKWHLGDELNAQHGWRDWRSIEDGMYRRYYTNKADLKRRSTYHEFLVRSGFPTDDVQESEADQPRIFSRAFSAGLAEQFTKVHYLAGEATRFLQERGRDRRPFILSVNTLEPHPPTFGPRNADYACGEAPEGPAFAQTVGAGASKLHRRRCERDRERGYYTFPYSTADDLRRLRANYYGLVSMVDSAYGRVLAALEKAGLADNTIVVYTSDHGDMLGDHWMMQKDAFYQQAVHIPLVIRAPWLTRSQTLMRGPVSQVDLMPTLLDLMGVGAPSGIDGQSWINGLRRPSSWNPSSAVTEWHDNDEACNGRSITSADGWRLNLYQGDEPELYDLNTDPGELNNLGRSSPHRDRVRRMGDALLAWQKQHRDHMPLIGG